MLVYMSRLVLLCTLFRACFSASPYRPHYPRVLEWQKYLVRGRRAVSSHVKRDILTWYRYMRPQRTHNAQRHPHQHL